MGFSLYQTQNNKHKLKGFSSVCFVTICFRNHKNIKKISTCDGDLIQQTKLKEDEQIDSDTNWVIIST